MMLSLCARKCDMCGKHTTTDNPVRGVGFLDVCLDCLKAAQAKSGARNEHYQQRMQNRKDNG